MFKKIAVAALATGALALNAPVALADTPTYGCNFRSVQQADATGQTFEGVAAGYVVHSEGGPVTIRCEIRVNGAFADSTDPGSGTGTATTQGRIQFQAGDTDVVTFHAIATAVHNGVTTTYTTNYQTTVTQIPPQEVIDLIDAIVIQYIDPTLCTVLATLAGNYGPLVINSQGDVYLNGEPQWDCPPYDIIWP